MAIAHGALPNLARGGSGAASNGSLGSNGGGEADRQGSLGSPAVGSFSLAHAQPPPPPPPARQQRGGQPPFTPPVAKVPHSPNLVHGLLVGGSLEATGVL